MLRSLLHRQVPFVFGDQFELSTEGERKLSQCHPHASRPLFPFVFDMCMWAFYLWLTGAFSFGLCVCVRMCVAVSVCWAKLVRRGICCPFAVCNLPLEVASV